LKAVEGPIAAKPDSDDPATRPVGYLALLRGNRRFRIFWLGELISLIGDWFNLVASATLLASLTHSGTALGALFALRMLTPFLLSPLAGVAADRFDRRKIMIATTLLRGIVVCGFFLVRGPQDVWLLYLLTALQLGIAGFFVPARSALLPEIVERKELGTANALDAVTWSSMLFIGAALGGLVSGQWGVRTAFAIDALSFFVSAAILWRLDYRAGLRTAGKLSAAARQYWDGLRYLFRRPDLLFTALHKAAFGFTVSGGVSVAMVQISQEHFVIGLNGGTALGLTYATIGLGTGLGPILVRRWTRDGERRTRLALGLAYCASAIGLLGIAAAVEWAMASQSLDPTARLGGLSRILASLFGPLSTGLAGPAERLGLSPSALTAFVVYLAFMALRAGGGGVNWVQSAQLLLMRIPSRMRGRVFASEFAIFTLGEAGGAAAAGWLLDRGGLDLLGLLRLEAGLVLIPALLWFAWIGRPPVGRRPALGKRRPNEAR
jgi:MFS family permease